MDAQTDIANGMAAPAGSWLTRYEALAAPLLGAVKITSVQALQLDFQGDGCLVKIETDAGVTGYGETGALISGIDIALWDAAGRILGLPIYRLMGGPLRNEVPMYSHGDALKDMSSAASCREWAQMIREQPEGFTAFKVEPTQAIKERRVWPGITTAQHEKVSQGFANVREAVGNEIDIGVHCHHQYGTPSAIAVAKATEAIHPLFFEDPLSNVEYCEGRMAIKRATRTPILTGEKLEMVKQFKPFIDSQAVDIIHPDISYAGGMTGCRKIADYAALNRTPVALHNVGSLVRTYASVHLAAGIGNSYRSECRLGRPGRIIEKMAANKPLVIRNSMFQLPEGPGLGLEIDPAFMREHTRPGDDWA